jgi:hypothetical protein
MVASPSRLKVCMNVLEFLSRARRLGLLDEAVLVLVESRKGGQFAPGGGRAAGTGTKAAGRKTTAKKSKTTTASKSRSKTSTGRHAVFGKREQDHAEAQQDRVAEGIDRGAKSIPGSAPSDVERVEKNGDLVCLELKCKLKSDKVRMTNAAQARKILRTLEHEQQTGHHAGFHTVAVDHRQQFKSHHLDDAPSFPAYYKRGAGSFKLADMHPVQTPEELNRLLHTPDDELPPAARPVTTGFWGEYNKASKGKREKMIRWALRNERKHSARDKQKVQVKA